MKNYMEETYEKTAKETKQVDFIVFSFDQSLKGGWENKEQNKWPNCQK